MKIPGVKSVLIAVLSFMVLAQAIWIIVSVSGDAKTPQVSSVQVMPQRYGLEVKFSAPVQLGELSLDAVGSVSPEIEGRWVHTEPDELRFVTENRLQARSVYTLTLADELSLEGERVFEFETSTFELHGIEMVESAGNTPGTSVIVASLEFNDDVAPEDLVDHLVLVDESTSEQVYVQVMSSWSSRYMEVQSDEIAKTTDGATYRLTVSKGLKHSDTAVDLKKNVSATIQLILDPVLHVKQVRPGQPGPTGTIRLSFSTPVFADDAASYISVRPQVDYSMSSNGSELLLSGDFKPGENYDVQIRDGVTAADGAVLSAAKSFAVTIPDLEPMVRFVGNGMFLPRSRMAGLVVEAVNTGGVDVRMDRIYPNNLFTMLREHGWKIFDGAEDYYSGVPEAMGGGLYEDRISLAGDRNESVKLPLDLSNIVNQGERGLFKISASLPDQYGVKRWLLVTDIGIVAKRDAKAFHVWTVSHDSLAPLAGVKLTLVSDKNQNLASAVSGMNGSAKLALPANHEAGMPYMILAQKGKDFSFLLPSRFGVDMAGLDVSGVPSSESGLRAYLYGERDLYRPGESLKGMAILRDGKLAAPPNMPMVLNRFDPKGRDVGAIRLTSGADGVAAFELPIQDHALTGTHSLALSAGGETIGSFDFKVEEFVPDRIKVEVTTSEQSFSPAESVQVQVRSNYLFGPPGANLPVTVRALLRPAPFAAKGYENYVFGDPQREFEPQDVYSMDDALDDQGGLSFSFALPSSLRPPAALEAIILGRVSESGGRGVTARKRVLVHPYEQYIGLKSLGKNGFDPQHPITFDFAVLDTDGKPAAHSGLKARLYKDRYRSVVRQTPSGGHRYESVNDPQLLTEMAIGAGKGKGDVVFTPPTYGSYSVEIVSAETGASARTGFYCGGWGYSPWALENPARVELVLDKKQYDAGETAVVQVRAPFPGRMLVAVESDTVRDTRIIDLSGNTGEVRFPVRSSYAPNAHVTAMLLRKGSDIGMGGVGRAFGAVPLLVDNLSNKLPLSVSGPAEVRPEAQLDIEVNAKPGAVVTLAAVDEGILQLSGSADPDPFDFFYARRALGVDSYDTFAMLYPDFARLLGESEAGGGMEMAAESQFMRTEGIRRVKPVSFWSGPLVAGADGMVRYSMSLPDFQGALRVVAVGVDGKRFGTGKTMVRVRSPLAVTPTLPRFLATGDSIEMPVTVRNDTGASASITVGVEASGAVESKAEVVTLQLDDGAEETVYLPLVATAGAGGPASIAVIAKGGGETRRVVIDLPVRPALPYKRELAFGTLTGQGGDMVPLAEGMVDGTVTRTVSLGGLPITRFAGKLEYLLRYPYGCAEQTTSKAFPLIRFGALAEALAPHLVEEGSAPSKVHAAIQRLGGMQTHQGGYAYWPGGEEPYPWVSAYVTHFLLETAQAGYGKSWMLPGALNYMAEIARSRRDIPVTAYALYNLAKAGQADRGSMDELRDKHTTKLGANGRMLLACAYAQIGDRESFSALLGKLPEVPGGRYPAGGMGSGLRDESLMLMTLADIDASDPLVGELARSVSQKMEASSWGTTLENGLAFAALGKALENTKPAPFSGELIIGETSMPFANTTQFNQDKVAGSGAVSTILGSDDATVYWSVSTRGVPAAGTFQPQSEGLELRRSFLDKDGNSMDATSLEQGALVIMKTELRSTTGNVDNLVLQALLPAGLEVENPRLGGEELLFTRPEGEQLIGGYQDLRDDRVLFFTDIAGDRWHAGYTQLRAVTPGEYALPPVQAEAMYDPSIIAATEPGTLDVVRKQ